MTKYFAHRSRSRHHIRCRFQYFVDGLVAEGSVWDLSAAGWRASGTHPVTTGMEMPVCLFLENEKRWVSIGRAAVRWVDGSNFGLEILQIDVPDKQRLDQFIELRKELRERPFPSVA